MTERIGNYYYFFPTYKQGRKILWDGKDKNGFPFIGHFPKELIAGKPNEVEMKIKYKNGSLFQIVGDDNIDSIVGANPVGVVFSEFSLQDPRGWDYIRPILAENDGWAIFNWTPRGKNHAYDLHEFAKHDSNWWTQVLTVDDTNIIDKKILEQEKLEIIARNGDDSLFYQEYYCSYLAAIMGAYYTKQYEEADKAGRFGFVPHEPKAKVHTVWDLGISDSMVVGFWQAVGQERRLIECLDFTGKGLPEVIVELKKKDYVYGKHFAPHDIKVRELGTGKSRWDTAKSLGVEFDLVPNISIASGIDATRMFWNKMWVDSNKCKKFLLAIPQYTKEFDETRKNFNDKPEHDWTSHFADMLRYSALVDDKMIDVKKPIYKQPDYHPQSEFEG